MSRSIASSIAATVVAGCTATACSSKATPGAAPPAPVQVTAVEQVTPDAYVPGITTIGTIDPSDVHLDDDSTLPPIARAAPKVTRQLGLRPPW